MDFDDYVPTLESRQRLRTVLQPLYLHHWVSEWVFNNLMQCPFHKDFLLPSSFFDDVAFIQCETRFQNPDYVSTTLSIQCEGHSSYIPVYNSDNITVGYAIVFNSDASHQMNSFKNNPFSTPSISRFVHNHSSGDLVYFVPSYEHNVISILSINNTKNWYDISIVPAKDYNWFDLPDHPVIAIKNYVNYPIFSDQETENETHINRLNKVDLTPNDIDELFRRISITPTKNTSSSAVALTNLNSSCQLQLSQSHRLANSVSRAVMSNEYILNKEERARSEAEFFKLFRNTKYCPGPRYDGNPVPFFGYDQAISLRNLHLGVVVPEDIVVQAMSPQYAKVYYSIVLSVSVERPLVRDPSGSTTEAKAGIHRQEIKILPRVETPIRDGSEKKETEKKDKATILRERRKRNRLSAARSNAKKQERIGQMEKDLERSKMLVKVLEEKRIDILLKNEELKRMLASMKGKG